MTFAQFVIKKLFFFLQGGNNSDVTEMCEDSSLPRGYVVKGGGRHLNSTQSIVAYGP